MALLQSEFWGADFPRFLLTFPVFSRSVFPTTVFSRFPFLTENGEKTEKRDGTYRSVKNTCQVCREHSAGLENVDRAGLAPGNLFGLHRSSCHRNTHNVVIFRLI